MVEEFTDMPERTVGFRIWGRITREDYELIFAQTRGC
jgi:hypothetical protein